MTIFADQTKNLVLASPDGSTGQPAFRTLVANDLPNITSYSSTSNGGITHIGNTASLIGPPLFLGANTLSVGDIVRITLSIQVGQLNLPSYDLSIHVGANGNISDSVLFGNNNIITQSNAYADMLAWEANNSGAQYNGYPGYPTGPYSVAPSPQVAPPYIIGEILVTVISTGTNANIAICSTNTSNTTTNLLDIFGPANNHFIWGYGTMNTEVDNYLSVSHTIQVNHYDSSGGPGSGEANTWYGAYFWDNRSGGTSNVYVGLIEYLS
jgi:hypothetical protein